MLNFWGVNPPFSQPFWGEQFTKSPPVWGRLSLYWWEILDQSDEIWMPQNRTFQVGTFHPSKKAPASTQDQCPA